MQLGERLRVNYFKRSVKYYTRGAETLVIKVKNNMDVQMSDSGNALLWTMGVVEWLCFGVINGTQCEV